MMRRIVRVLMVGLGFTALSVPAAADHISVSSGFRENLHVRSRLHRAATDVQFVAGSDTKPNPRPVPPGGGKKDKDKNKGLFGDGPTVILPDEIPAVTPGGGFADSGAGASGPSATTPEPASLLLLGAGLGAAVWYRARRRHTEPI